MSHLNNEITLDYHAKMDALKAQKSLLDAAASEGS
jgi:hypothetical protein